jgi:hypothetical protein
MSGSLCFAKLMPNGEFYDPACDVLEQLPPDAPEVVDLRETYVCPECQEDVWRALKAAADGRAAKSNGKVKHCCRRENGDNLPAVNRSRSQAPGR